MDVTQLLARVREPENLETLATLSVDALLARPIGEAIDARAWAERSKRALDSYLGSAEATPALTGALGELRAAWSEDRRPLEEVLGPELRDAVSRAAGRPHTIDRSIVLAVLDRPRVRELLRGFMLEAVLEFAQKVRAPVRGATRGIAGIARSMAGATGSLGAIAGGVMAAAGTEVERQLEKRAREFVDAAIGPMIRRIADRASDPDNAAAQAQLRAELLEGVLGLRLSQLARELDPARTASWGADVNEALTTFTRSPDATDRIEAWIRGAIAAHAQEPLDTLLSRFGLREAVRETARATLLDQLRTVVASPAFDQWLTGLAAR